MGELGERRWSLCCRTYTPYFHASPQWRLPFPLQESPYFTYPFVSLFFTSLHPLLYLFLFPIIHLFFTHLSHLTHPQYHRRERGGERTAVAKQLAWPTRCGEANKEEEGHDDGGGDKGTRKERRGEERRGDGGWMMRRRKKRGQGEVMVTAHWLQESLRPINCSRCVTTADQHQSDTRRKSHSLQSNLRK